MCRNTTGELERLATKASSGSTAAATERERRDLRDDDLKHLDSPSNNDVRGCSDYP
jgi:hypothetical protein